MYFYKRFLLTLSIFFLGFATITFGQESNTPELYGDFRIIYSGSSLDSHGFGGKADWLRGRVGLKYDINSNHSVAGRAVYIFSRDPETPSFSLTANGKLAADTFSFDEFYYRYKDEKNMLKLGRFQKSFSLPTTTGNSIMRFQSSSVSSSWSDGLYYQRKLNDGWASDIILEYQNRGNLTFPYKNPLSFGKNEHNLMGYFGFINNTRDEFNFVQKNISIMWAPDAFFHNGNYMSYLTINGSLVFDYPLKEALHGGSFRVTGELGKNMATNFKDGVAATASFGVYDVADIHNLTAEFSRNGRYYLNSPYSLNSNNFELRYGVQLTAKFSMEARYHIRSSLYPYVSNIYSTFVRATYSL